MIKLETQPWCLISTGSCGVGLVVILVGVWPVIIITWQYPGWWPVPGLTWRLSCWQWRWPLGTSCAHSAAQHRSRQPGGRRNAGTQPQPGAGWGTPGSSFLRGERIKLCQNCLIFLHASAQNGAALQSLKVYHEVQKFFMKCWVFCCVAYLVLLVWACWQYWLFWWQLGCFIRSVCLAGQQRDCLQSCTFSCFFVSMNQWQGNFGTRIVCVVFC